MSHAERDAHLFEPGRKRILALDGGGIRGVLTLGMLQHVESILRQRHRAQNLVLSDYFDLIAGTSTGSIIATLLAMGRPVQDCIELYQQLGPQVFSRPRLAGQLLWSKFNHTQLEKILSDKLATHSLNSVALKTGLLITCKRVDTGSAWIQCNNRKGVYWKYDALRELRQLVRASTAAPTFFEPARLQIGNGETGLFLDGAMGGHNNPSLSTFLYATVSEYKLNWTPKDDQLFMLSLGTGYFRPRYDVEKFWRKSAAQQGVLTLSGLIHETSVTAITVMQSLSSPTNPFIINSEIKGLEETLIGGANMLSFERIDASLERADLESAGLSFKITGRIYEKLKSMDNGEKATIDRLLEIGDKRGKQIDADTVFPAVFDLQPAEVLSPNAH